jgi:hypothetical protein
MKTTSRYFHKLSLASIHKFFNTIQCIETAYSIDKNNLPSFYLFQFFSIKIAYLSLCISAYSACAISCK